MKTTYQPTCWKRVYGSYQEPSGIVWDYEAMVRVAYNDFEVMEVNLDHLAGYSSDGESVANHYAPLQTLKDHAGAKAIETLETVDFEMEAENE